MCVNTALGEPEPPELTLSWPLANVSSALGAADAACVYDLYTGRAHGPVDPRTANLTVEALGAHDAAFWCVHALEDVDGRARGECDKPASRGACPGE